MPPMNLSNLPSVKKQQLLSEFAGLKQACPSGVFVSLTPDDPGLWSAVMFIREGPYSPAVLRFQVLFPPSYPRLPPIITFSTDIFHPLITPLTTYMYTTDIQDNGTVSATDEERLPPGGFSLRHGFPDWFQRGRKTAHERGLQSPAIAQSVHQTPMSSPEPGSTRPANHSQPAAETPSIYAILKYVKSTFSEETVLDSVQLDAAGNPGAWHAWRTYRKKLGKLSGDVPTSTADAAQPVAEVVAPTMLSAPSTPSKLLSPSKGRTGPATIRRPGEWNWDGVWEDRVKKGISSSLSEPVLYGGTSPTEEMIHFLALEHPEIESIKGNLKQTLGTGV